MTQTQPEAGCPYRVQGGICQGERGRPVVVTEFRGMALNGLFCSDVLRPLHLFPSRTLPANITLAGGIEGS